MSGDLLSGWVKNEINLVLQLNRKNVNLVDYEIFLGYI